MKNSIVVYNVFFRSSVLILPIVMLIVSVNSNDYPLDLIAGSLLLAIGLIEKITFSKKSISPTTPILFWKMSFTYVWKDIVEVIFSNSFGIRSMQFRFRGQSRLIMLGSISQKNFNETCLRFSHKITPHLKGKDRKRFDAYVSAKKASM